MIAVMFLEAGPSGAPELLIALALLNYVALTFPIYLAARRLGVTHSGWAFLPIGNLVTLIRSAGAPIWTLIAFMVPLANLVTWAACWVAVCRRAAMHPGWGWACLIPGASFVLPFLIAVRIHNPAHDGLQVGQPFAEPSRYGMGSGRELSSDSTYRGRHESRRRVTIELPPSWLVVHALTVALLATGVWYDSRNTHYFLADPGELTQLESRMAAIESRPRAISTTTLTQTDSRVSRAIDVAALGYILSYAGSQNLGSEAAAAVYKRCWEWIQSGSGSFEAACR